MTFDLVTFDPGCVLTGFYMYIETSRPRLEGDKARLLSPTFNMNPKTSSSSSVTYCFSFYYHMYGKHVGKSAHRTQMIHGTL